MLVSHHIVTLYGLFRIVKQSKTYDKMRMNFQEKKYTWNYCHKVLVHRQLFQLLVGIFHDFSIFFIFYFNCLVYHAIHSILNSLHYTIAFVEIQPSCAQTEKYCVLFYFFIKCRQNIMKCFQTVFFFILH